MSLHDRAAWVRKRAADLGLGALFVLSTANGALNEKHVEDAEKRLRQAEMELVQHQHGARGAPPAGPAVVSKDRDAEARELRAKLQEKQAEAREELRKKEAEALRGEKDKEEAYEQIEKTLGRKRDR